MCILFIWYVSKYTFLMRILDDFSIWQRRVDSKCDLTWIYQLIVLEELLAEGILIHWCFESFKSVHTIITMIMMMIIIMSSENRWAADEAKSVRWNCKVDSSPEVFNKIYEAPGKSSEQNESNLEGFNPQILTLSRPAIAAFWFSQFFSGESSLDPWT